MNSTLRPLPFLPRLRRRSDRRGGFTLIELTVTLALIGVIMATIYTVLFGTIRAKKQLELRVMGSRIGPLLLDTIERDIRQLFIYNVDHGHVLVGEDGKDYGRDADRIMFVAQGPSTSPLITNDKAVYSNVNEIGYVVTRNEANNDFMVLWRREDYFVDDEPLEGGKGTPLYRRVTQFDVKYYDTLGEDAEEIDEWDPKERKGLPKALEISLSLEVEPRQVGVSIDADELARRTYSFKRWITFPQDSKYAVAVRPAVPVPPEEYEEGIGAGAGPGGPDAGGGGGADGASDAFGSGGGSGGFNDLFGSGGGSGGSGKGSGSSGKGGGGKKGGPSAGKGGGKGKKGKK